MKDFINFITDPANKDVITSITAMVSVIIASISALIAIIATIQNRTQYKKSIQPLLSMKLVEYEYFLYLQIKNTGKLAAKDITIKILSIENNGEHNQLSIGNMFNEKFELYPEETVQDEIAIFGASIANNAFPKIAIEVSYRIGDKKKKLKYNRTVTFVSAYNEKISADINMDTRKIESSADAIAKAAVRTANYLDGCQIASFDNLDIISGKTLENDLHQTLGQKLSPVLSREDALQNEFDRRKGENDNANT